MRRPLLALAALAFLVVSFAPLPVVRADGVAFEMLLADGSSFGTLIVCRDGLAISGTIEVDGRVLCGPALFERTGRRQGQLMCEDGTVLEVFEREGLRGLFFGFRGVSGALRRTR